MNKLATTELGFSLKMDSKDRSYRRGASTSTAWHCLHVNCDLRDADSAFPNSRLGIVIDPSDVDAAISAAPAAGLLERIFDLAGFTTSLSNGGLIARQLITRLDGLQGARVFKIPGVRRLIRTHGPNASFTKKSALQLIGGKDPENPAARFSDHERLFIEERPYNTKLSPADVVAYLVEKGLFRIGVDLTCPACRLPSWTALDSLKQRIVCPLCGDEFDGARQLVGEHWSYRQSGVLGLEKNNHGDLRHAYGR